MKKLILFDIDGTLINPGTLARKLIDEAIAELTGDSPDLSVEDVAGFTDPSIVRNALLKLKYRNGSLENNVETILSAYLKKLKQQYADCDEPKHYKDAVKLVNSCKKQEWHVGLFSGNLRESAKIKLDRFNLWDEFSFGIFGDDAYERGDMLWMAPELAWDALGEAYTHDRIILVGDTPNDAKVANENNVRSLIVCRRPQWRNKIISENPTWIVETLENSKEIVKWIKES